MITQEVRAQLDSLPTAFLRVAAHLLVMRGQDADDVVPTLLCEHLEGKTPRDVLARIYPGMSAPLGPVAKEETDAALIELGFEREEINQAHGAEEE